RRRAARGGGQVALLASRTRWVVRDSEGLDAISFLQPLSARRRSTKPYAEELARFAPRLPAEVRADVPRLWEEAAQAGVGLLAPALDAIFSRADNGDTLTTVLTGLEAPEQRLLPAFRDSPHWSEEAWSWLMQTRSRLITVFRGLQTAGFGRFRAERAGKSLGERVASVQRDLSGFDVI